MNLKEEVHIKSLCNIIDKQSIRIRKQDVRIAELEAEVERLKAFCNEWVHNEEAFQKESAVEVCPIITEEGQG